MFSLILFPIILLFLFVPFIALIVLLIVIGRKQAKKRRETLSYWATRQGLRFNPDRNSRMDKRFAFSALRQGNNRYAYNIMDGDYDGRYVLAFDYHYETESTDSDGDRTTHHHYFSAIIFKTHFPLNKLAIRPEHFFDRVSSFFGRDDIDFESAAFSKAFHVSAEDRKWAYDILHGQAIEWLMNHPKHHIEFNDQHVLIARGGRTFKSEDFELALKIADGLLDMVPAYVKENQQAIANPKPPMGIH